MNAGTLLLVALIITAIVTLVRIILERSARGKVGQSGRSPSGDYGTRRVSGEIDEAENKKTHNDQAESVGAT